MYPKKQIELKNRFNGLKKNKMRTKIKLLALCVSILLIGCNSNQNKSTNQDNKNIATEAITKEKETVNEKSTTELIQGKWQHIDDKTNYLVFDKNHRKEIAGGMTKWDDEEFIISNKCLNESNKDIANEIEKDKYISCPKSDLCWYIISVDDDNLVLSFMARGNTLKYRRVK